METFRKILLSVDTEMIMQMIIYFIQSFLPFQHKSKPLFIKYS